MRNIRIQSGAAANLSCRDHSNSESTLRIPTRASNVAGTSMPSDLAVCRFTDLRSANATVAQRIETTELML